MLKHESNLPHKGPSRVNGYILRITIEKITVVTKFKMLDQKYLHGFSRCISRLLYTLKCALKIPVSVDIITNLRAAGFGFSI